MGGMNEIQKRWVVFIGERGGSEVGGKKFYPSLKAQLKYVLQEIVPTLEGISYSFKLHCMGGHSYSPQHNKIIRFTCC